MPEGLAAYAVLESVETQVAGGCQGSDEVYHAPV